MLGWYSQGWKEENHSKLRSLLRALDATEQGKAWLTSTGPGPRKHSLFPVSFVTVFYSMASNGGSNLD